MPDQFDKTISSISDDYAHVKKTEVQRTKPVDGKKVDRKKSATDQSSDEGRQQPMYSELKLPVPELWDTLLEAVRRFNKHQDVLNSPFAIRIWAQNNGLRVQLIQEDTGDLIKQTKIIPFADLTTADLNELINDLIRERGIVIDFTR